MPEAPDAKLPKELEVLSADVGTWDADVLVRPSPGAAPIPSKGVMTSRLVAGGRWLVTEFRNESTGFEGHGIYGWDPTRRSYVATWVDNERTFLTVGEGTWDPAAHTMTYRWQAEARGRTLRWRDVSDKHEHGKLVFRSFVPGPDGAEFEMMTVTYRRRG